MSPKVRFLVRAVILVATVALSWLALLIGQQSVEVDGRPTRSRDVHRRDTHRNRGCRSNRGEETGSERGGGTRLQDRRRDRRVGGGEHPRVLRIRENRNRGPTRRSAPGRHDQQHDPAIHHERAHHHDASDHHNLNTSGAHDYGAGIRGDTGACRADHHRPAHPGPTYDPPGGAANIRRDRPGSDQDRRRRCPGSERSGARRYPIGGL